MIEELTLATQWWSWWSNPLIDIHPDHRLGLDFKLLNTNKIGYFHLLELRSLMGLSDLPDEQILARSELRSLALSQPEVRQSNLYKFSLLTLDSAILHARPQDWEINFDVRSPELIREIIGMRNEFPEPLLQIQSKTSRHIAQSLKNKMSIGQRADLGLGIYLQSFYPKFFSRWKITQSKEFNALLKHSENIPEELWDTTNRWIENELQSVHNSVLSTFEIQDIETGFSEEDLKLLEEFDSDELDALSVEARRN